jgi:signal transduction histidine kinase
VENRPIKWLAFGLFFAIAATAAGLGLGRLDRFADADDELRDQPFLVAEALLRAHDHIRNLQTRLHDQAVSGDAEGARQAPLRASEDDLGLLAALDVVVEHQSGNHETMAALMAALSAWRGTRERVADLLAEGRWQDAVLLHDSDGERSYHVIHNALDKALETERRRAAELRAVAGEELRKAHALVIGLAVLVGGAIACTGTGLVVWLNTHRPMSRLRTSMLALASGDTSAAIPYTRAAGAIGDFARAIHCFRDSVLERDAVARALRRSKAELRQAVAEARHAEAAKNRFLAAASHDLRQPLQALRLYLDTLERRLSDRLDRRVLNGALSALGAAEDLLGNYLDVSVLESGIVKPSPADMAIAPMLADVMQEWRGPADDKGLSLRLVSCGAVVRSDPTLLRRVLRNLVANAVRYTEQGGVLVGCRRRGNSLRIEVWDTGIGIPPDQLQVVFEDFYQIGNPERDRANGLGLGLSVVDRAAHLLRHPVSVVSTPGAGSMFAITVPLAGDGTVRADSLAA